MNNKKIEGLHPLIRKDVKKFIEDVSIELNVTLIISHGFRTFKEQELYYSKGRLIPGDIVTNAKAGESYHNYGLAFDLKSISSQISNYERNGWNDIASIGNRYGFEWGGDFTTIDDFRHFQKTFGFHHTVLLSLLKKRKTRNSFVILPNDNTSYYQSS